MWLRSEISDLFCVTLKLHIVNLESYASEFDSRYLFCCEELPHNKISVLLVQPFCLDRVLVEDGLAEIKGNKRECNLRS